MKTLVVVAHPKLASSTTQPFLRRPLKTSPRLLGIRSMLNLT
ncbi:hypothetical protein QY883_01530 [Pediococcus acidilactici]